MNRQGRDCYRPITIDKAWLDLLNDGFVTGIVRVFETMDADIDVLTPSGLDVFDHFTRAFWSIDFQGFAAAYYPRTEDQIRKAERVVRVQMREENTPQLRRSERRNPSLCECSRGTPNDARPRVENISRALVNHGACWSGSLGSLLRRAGS